MERRQIDKLIEAVVGIGELLRRSKKDCISVVQFDIV
jgi:hypothetical protein